MKIKVYKTDSISLISSGGRSLSVTVGAVLYSYDGYTLQLTGQNEIQFTNPNYCYKVTRTHENFDDLIHLERVL